jgi:hypothetical protein
MPKRPPRRGSGNEKDFEHRSMAYKRAYISSMKALYGGTKGSEEKTAPRANVEVFPNNRTRLKPDDIPDLTDPCPAKPNTADKFAHDPSNVPRGTLAAVHIPPVEPDWMPRNPKTEQTLPEWREQSNLVHWIKTTMVHCRKHVVMIPNGGYKTPSQHQVAKMMGFCRGASDLFLMRPSMGYHGLFLEMKEARYYTPSERSSETWRAQENFIMVARDVGYAAHFCFGMDHGIKLIHQYFEMINDGKQLP